MNFLDNLYITVTQLNKYVHSVFDGDSNLKSVFIIGEISNLKVNSFSGHMYLTLKDDNAAVKAVMFKNNAARLKFIPKEGMKVICSGSVSVYEKDGQYQLYINDMQPDGKGSISEAFEQLKQKLFSEGLFDASRKKPIPKFPSKIAIITSETGAAVQDMINVIGRRWPLATLVMCPVKVQGDGASEQIINAIMSVNNNTDCDVIIVGRGGGSTEDLWCFNDEKLARVVAGSKIPIISAVGHETDFTIIDFVSDLRAPTPSAAAELAVPDINDLYITVSNFSKRINSSFIQKLNFYNERISELSIRRVFTDKYYFVDFKSIQLDNLMNRLNNSFSKVSSSASEKLSSLVAKLDALSPTSVLLRGYSILQKNGKSVKSICELSNNDNVVVKVSDGNVSCTINEIKGDYNNE